MPTGLLRVRHLKVPGSKKEALLKPESPSTANRDAVQHVLEKTTMLNLQRKADASSNTFIGQRHRTCGTDSKHRRSVLGPVVTGSTHDRFGYVGSLVAMIAKPNRKKHA